MLRRRCLLPTLHYRESALNSRLLAKCGLRQRLFSPAFWLRCATKGVVALDWVMSVHPRVKRKSTVLLVLPPITGDAMTVSALCHMATRRGFRTLVFNRRGHGAAC
nr:hypothetical protein BaRGS_002857 [Batillaria attramentaria]